MFESTYWYLNEHPELMNSPCKGLMHAGRARYESRDTRLAPLLQGFFTTRLMQQKQVSPTP